MSTKPNSPYIVRWVKCAAGERLPLLINTASGLPIESVTYWIVAHRRAVGCQPTTLYNELRCLRTFYLWGEIRSIDLDQRLRTGRFFTLSELIDLVDFTGRYLSELSDSQPPSKNSNLRSSAKRPPSICAVERRNRLYSIRSFIDFTSADYLSELQRWPDKYKIYSEVRKECTRFLSEQSKSTSTFTRSSKPRPEGLSRLAIDRLRELIEPSSESNPFNDNVRIRNYLMIHMLLELGIRKGELLGIHVGDCVLGGTQGTLRIARRGDDNVDPRKERPSTKTRARTLGLSHDLVETLHKWIVEHRPNSKKARKHPYLFTSTAGTPLTISALDKIFLSLRRKDPTLLGDLSPHRLRHSWNDMFSELSDKKGISPEQEVKWRTRLMGWSNEKTAAHYLRRTVRKRSNEFLREMQDEAFKIVK